ncbi:MAG: TIGR02597 family protein [Verrucomicrobia bacterium]|nr:MAG: TIGR02597 family protein [Verrucomicrobiota bacterium]
MTTNKLLPLLVASFLAPIALHAQNTATTTPVGYVTYVVPAESDANISVPLMRNPEFSGTIQSVSANTVTVANASFATNPQQFVFDASQDKFKTYYLEVMTGPIAGRRFKVLANDVNTITLDPDAANSVESQGLTASSTFQLVPYWTLETLYPNGAGIGTNSSPFAPETTLLFTDARGIGTDRSSVATYFHYDGSVGGDAGWYNADNLGAGLQSHVIIDPGFTITIRNSKSSPLTLVNSGSVRISPAAVPVDEDVEPNDVYLQLPFAVDTSLNASGLLTNGVIRSSDNPFSPLDVVYVYDVESTGQDVGVSATYFHYSGAVGGPSGWYDANNLNSGIIGENPLLKAGSSIVIRKGPGVANGVTIWQAPMPYNLNQ